MIRLNVTVRLQIGMSQISDMPHNTVINDSTPYFSQITGNKSRYRNISDPICPKGGITVMERLMDDLVISVQSYNSDT